MYTFCMHGVYTDIFVSITANEGTWVGVVVKALRYWSEVFFPGISDSSICPGVDSASKNEYQDIPGAKDGRCVRVTTLPPSCAECLEILEP